MKQLAYKNAVYVRSLFVNFKKNLELWKVIFTIGLCGFNTFTK